MRIVMGIFSILLILMGLYMLNVTAYNYWAAGGPPNPHPEVFMKRGHIALLISFSLFGSAALLLNKTRKIGKTSNKSL